MYGQVCGSTITQKPLSKTMSPAVPSSLLNPYDFDDDDIVIDDDDDDNNNRNHNMNHTTNDGINNHDNYQNSASFSMVFSPAASSLASTPGGIMYSHNANHDSSRRQQQPHHLHHQPQQPLELEVDWDPATVKMELLQATAVLSHRGLKLAAQWAAEQLVGIPSTTTTTTTTGSHRNTSTHTTMNSLQLDSWSTLTHQDWYAKSLLDLGEYLHAAHVLSSSSSSLSTTTHSAAVDILQIPGPAPDLSNYGIYLRAYALYMAGERRKEEDHLELQSEPQKQKSCRNPYLSQLMDELEQAYSVQSLDAFGLYVYGLVLKEGQADTLTCPRPPHTVLMESILQFPYNWSAWLDLAEVLVFSQNGGRGAGTGAGTGVDSKDDNNTRKGGGAVALEQQIEQVLQPNLATHYMYHFFCAHIMSHHHQAHEDALVLYDRLYEPMPDQPLFMSSYLKSQMGVAHYHLREFDQALEWFHQIQDPYLLDNKDVYSNILYVREDRVALSHLAHQAVQVDKYRPETCCIIGNYYSLKQKRQKAVLYFQRALKLDRNYTSAWTLMGHEYVELKQTEAAMEAYRRAVNVSPKDYRAWYGLGQTYEFLNMHLYALFYYRKAAMLRPYDARMWCAVGLCFVALHKIPDAIRAYERAVAQDDTEGIATQKLATLYRQEGRTEEAAQCYLRHLELRYLVTGTTGVVAAAASSPPPTLDEIIQGVVVEAPEAEAMVFLAHYYKSHGEYDMAALMCSRLVEYPGPEKEQAKGLLRDLRSRGRRFTATSYYPKHPAATEGIEDNDNEKTDFAFSP